MDTLENFDEFIVIRIENVVSLRILYNIKNVNVSLFVRFRALTTQPITTKFRHVTYVLRGVKKDIRYLCSLKHAFLNLVRKLVYESGSVCLLRVHGKIVEPIYEML